MLQQLALFSLVGGAGFLVDAGTLLLLHQVFGMDVYVARLLSWLVAATSTWWMNRTLTFRNRDAALWRQWLLFLGANSGGGLINLGVSSLLLSQHVAPVAAVACGSIAGLLWNFLASRRFVFGRSIE
ncbi:MAG TPA: GtrA family protein [Steroidobacteraceae bacterium]|nr:GtrA family protein [Steroidobacteraceae bacterium]